MTMGVNLIIISVLKIDFIKVYFMHEIQKYFILVTYDEKYQ